MLCGGLSGNYRICLEILVPCEIGNRGFTEKIVFPSQKIEKSLGIADNGDLSPDEVLRLSEATDAKPEDVVQIDRRISGRDMSLNAPISDVTAL